MTVQDFSEVRWQAIKVSAPWLDRPTPVVAARNIPYIRGANRFQNLSVYLSSRAETISLVGTRVTSLPRTEGLSDLPQYLVHVHGGAWRDPVLGAASIEPTVAHAFADGGESSPILAVASLNYSLTQFPTHPGDPYDAVKDHHADPAREAEHPDHVHDVYRGLTLLRALGLEDRSYILSGHSCGATIAFQAALQSPDYYGLRDVVDAPQPAAILGLNGLYDLPALVDGLGASHEMLRHDYAMMLSNAFGSDRNAWALASPARFEPERIAERVAETGAPRVVLIDQSTDDQLVPMNQRDRLVANLSAVKGWQVELGRRCVGKHAAPWQQGAMLWDSVVDALAALKR